MPFLVDGFAEPSSTVDERRGKRPPPDPINALREVLNRGALSKWPNRDGKAFFRQDHSADLAAHPQEAPCDSPSDPEITEPDAGVYVFSKKQAELLLAFSTPRAYGLLKLNDHWASSSKSKMVTDTLETERKRALRTDSYLMRALRSPHSCKPVRKTTFWTPAELTKWSALLAPVSRVRAAKALLIIRTEKARQKERTQQGLNEDEE